MAGVVALGGPAEAQAAELAAVDALHDIQPLLEKHCVRCHGGEKVKGKVDFTLQKTNADVDKAFETWEVAAELVEFEEMPPEDEPQLTPAERELFATWYKKRFVEKVEAAPAPFTPRRLCANEYRNTLRSLFGFDLENAIIEAEQTVAEKSMVMKLLPIDPPGPSGFKNDTHHYPISSLLWDRYAYLVDAAIQRLFAPTHRAYLEAYTGPIGAEGLTADQAERLLRKFVPRAYRRDVTPADLAPVLGAVRGLSGRKLETALKAEIKAVTMSPGFLYRGVLMPLSASATDTVQPVDDFELAERLSYFLWADTPDDELMRLASQGRLSEPAVYAEQIDRMLAATKSRNLAEDMAVQWFTLNEIEDPRKNPPVTVALRSEPIDFLHYLFTEDRPLMELIDSDVTFINRFLSKYYQPDAKQLQKVFKRRGIEVQAEPTQRIRLEASEGRGGLLAMPGVLTMNKGPVLRGTWMLERILGVHLGEPPADVPPIESTAPDESLTFRQRFEQHRANDTCALCHDKIDPLGFALDGYDNSGGYAFASNYASQKDRKIKVIPDPATIDTSAKLPSGETFEGIEGLKAVLQGSQRGAVIRNIVERFMAYALARKLEVYDQPTVDAIAQQLDSSNGTYRDLIHAIANSLPFRKTLVLQETPSE
jgi:hypothetical protein